MDQLPIFLSLADRAVILVGEGEAAAAKARLVTAAGGRIVGEAEDGVVAFVALDDEGAAAAAAARLRARGLLVNVVDRPAMSDFLMGAIIDRSPVVVAVSTGGASASLARALRGRLEALLPASLGRLAAAIYAARGAAKKAHPDVSDRRRLWERALTAGGRLDPLRSIADPEAAVSDTIDSIATIISEVWEIDVPDADPGNLTLNALMAMGRCDVLVVEGDVPATVIDRARRDAIRMDHVPSEPEGVVVVLRDARPSYPD